MTNAPPSFPPTARQADLLRFLEGFIAERGVSPTYREMAMALLPGSNPFKAKNSIAQMLESLAARGAIARQTGPRGRAASRSIVVLRPAPTQRQLTRAEGLAFARAWRTANKPYFDAIYGPERLTGCRA